MNTPKMSTPGSDGGLTPDPGWGSVPASAMRYDPSTEAITAALNCMHDTINSGFTGLRNGVRSLSEDVKSLKEDFKSLSNEVKAMNNNVVAVNNSVIGVGNDIKSQSSDIKVQRYDIHAEVSNIRKDVRDIIANQAIEIKGLRNDFHDKFSNLREDLRGDVKGLSLNVKGLGDKMLEEFSRIRKDVRGDVKSLSNDVKDLSIDQHGCMVLCNDIGNGYLSLRDEMCVTVSKLDDDLKYGISGTTKKLHEDIQDLSKDLCNDIVKGYSSPYDEMRGRINKLNNNVEDGTHGTKKLYKDVKDLSEEIVSRFQLQSSIIQGLSFGPRDHVNNLALLKRLEPIHSRDTGEPLPNSPKRAVDIYTLSAEQLDELLYHTTRCDGDRAVPQTLECKRWALICAYGLEENY